MGEIKELVTELDILTVDRPFRCHVSACKCFCYQEMSFKSGGQNLGKIEETCFYCVPVFKVLDEKGGYIYKIHSPTCCSGMCPNCCAECNPCCGKACCKVPFHIFPSTQDNTHDGADYAGKIVKVPRSILTEIFTDAEAYEVTFPENATASEKALIMGSAIFINANFFEY